MKEHFLIDQKPLLAILSSMQPICSKRTTLEATAYILFNVGPKELILKSTDLEISLQSSYHLEKSTFNEATSFLVNGKRLFDIVKELDDTITFVVEQNQLIVHANGVKLSLNIKDAQEFPPFPERIENLMQLDTTVFATLLEKVAFLIPQNNANPSLNGLFIEIDERGLSLTTTDGHCLAQIQTNTYVLEQKKQWLLPRKAVLELKKLLELNQNTQIFLGTCGNQLVFSGENFNFFTKLLTSSFPEYKAILERTNFVPARVDKTAFVKTLRRSSCLLSGQFIATSFAFKADNVEVAMHNKEVGKLEETVSLRDFSGDGLNVKFYAPYLLNGLNAFSQEDVTFYLASNTKPIIFESAEKAFTITYLVMPVSATAS